MKMNAPKKAGPATFPSLMDTDHYKLTMLQLEWLLHRGTPVEWAFLNRTKLVHLPAFIPLAKLQESLDRIQNFYFSPEDIAYLRDSDSTRGLFLNEFLIHLSGLVLPRVIATPSVDGSTFEIRPAGDVEAGIWETFNMNVVSRLYFAALLKRSGKTEADAWGEGDRRLTEKIRLLEKHPEIKFIDFGTRRRWSPEWHEHVLRRLMTEVPQNLLGTSNLYLAKKLGLPAHGTLAHQEDMFYQGLYFDEDEHHGRLFSHEVLLHAWFDLYGERLAIALPDTYGSDYFRVHFTREQAKKWRGVRDDSGDTFVNGDRWIAFYRSLDIDPETKLFVPSDGLTLPKMIDVADYFYERIQTPFGWGTDLTNDLGFDPISIVVKMARVNGHEVAKLSDNRNKTTGTPEAVERVRRLANYNGTFSEVCRY